MTTQVEDFLDGLYESDRESHRLANQAILILERNGPAGEWSRWYRHAIPEAEQLYATYLKEREVEMRDGRG